MPQCQFTETTPGKEWTCSVCGFVAKTNGRPEMECGKAPVVTPKPARVRRGASTKAAPRDPREQENRYLAEPACANRGVILETSKPCMACGAKDQVYDVYQCSVFGKCTLGNRRKAGDPPMANCVGCEKHTERVQPAAMTGAFSPA